MKPSAADHPPGFDGWYSTVTSTSDQPALAKRCWGYMPDPSATFVARYASLDRPLYRNCRNRTVSPEPELEHARRHDD